jgi:hypothetical protein
MADGKAATRGGEPSTKRKRVHVNEAELDVVQAISRGMKLWKVTMSDFPFHCTDQPHDNTLWFTSEKLACATRDIFICALMQEFIDDEYFPSEYFIDKDEHDDDDDSCKSVEKAHSALIDDPQTFFDGFIGLLVERYQRSTDPIISVDEWEPPTVLDGLPCDIPRRKRVPGIYEKHFPHSNASASGGEGGEI